MAMGARRRAHAITSEKAAALLSAHGRIDGYDPEIKFPISWNTDVVPAGGYDIVISTVFKENQYEPPFQEPVR